MEILSVSLKNFKSHSDRYFEFQPGTNAICGENGAGKTSVLEAIAWVLFNYADYSKEELVRRGAASAQVTVTFVSSADKRTYQVRRCTNSGYEIIDPQLKVNLGIKKLKEEVMPWLRQQLGVARNTELPDLLANTIGIPQGTFTADFLKSNEARKKVFDPILKVEEYKQTYTKTAKLEAFAKAKVEDLQRAIAHYTESLRDWETLQAQRTNLKQEIAQEQATLQHLQAQLGQLQQQKDELSAQAQEIQQLDAQQVTLEAQITGQQQTQALLQQSLQRAQQAVATCAANQEGYQAFLDAETALQTLGQQAKQQQTLLKQRQGYQTRWESAQAQVTKLSVQLESLAKAQQEIEQLQPLVQQQSELEQAQTSIVEQLQIVAGAKLSQKNLSQQLAKLQAEQQQLTAEIERVRGLETAIAEIPTWEQQRDRLQAQLSRVEAAKQFEAELQQLVSSGQIQRDRYQTEADTAIAGLQELQQAVPLLSSSVDTALNALQAGLSLNADLLGNIQQILDDLSPQTATSQLKQQLATVKQQLEQGYQQKTIFATLENLIARQANLQAQAAELHAQLTNLQAQLATEADLQQQQQQLHAQLQALNNPRGRSQIRQQELQQQAQLQQQYDQVQQAQAEIEQELAQLDTTLAVFADLPEQIEAQQVAKDSYQVARDLYLQNQKDAAQLPNLEANFQAAIAHLETLKTEHIDLQNQFQQLTATYDPQQLLNVEAQYNHLRSQKDQLAGSLPQRQKFLQQIEQQLADLQAIADKRTQAQQQLTERQRIQQFITDARQVYNQAGPRITKFYIEEISREADKLFRELVNRQNVALEWTGDYEIRVQEGGYWRSFKSLSGGEQMCAALAVRLALLKVLADIDVAFFDEPTTNMDQARRQQLAEAIGNLKTFRQLFIISHDDTFESVTENLIRVEREAI